MLIYMTVQKTELKYLSFIQQVKTSYEYRVNLQPVGGFNVMSLKQ